jgi:hypothetical protein
MFDIVSERGNAALTPADGVRVFLADVLVSGSQVTAAAQRALVFAAVPARLDTGAHSEPVVKRGSEVT